MDITIYVDALLDSTPYVLTLRVVSILSLVGLLVFKRWWKKESFYKFELLVQGSDGEVQNVRPSEDGEYRTWYLSPETKVVGILFDGDLTNISVGEGFYSEGTRPGYTCICVDKAGRKKKKKGTLITLFRHKGSSAPCFFLLGGGDKCHYVFFHEATPKSSRKEEEVVAPVTVAV